MMIWFSKTLPMTVELAPERADWAAVKALLTGAKIVMPWTLDSSVMSWGETELAAVTRSDRSEMLPATVASEPGIVRTVGMTSIWRFW